MQNHTNQKKNILPQPNQQPNSNVANYGLMYVNNPQQVGANQVIRTQNNQAASSIHKEKRTSMAVAQQFSNSPMKTTPSKMLTGQVGQAGLNVYIVKP